MTGLVVAQGFEQIFTHIDEDGTVRSVAVDRLRAWIKDHPGAAEQAIFPVERKQATWIKEKQGVEQHRLERLQLREHILDPILVLSFEDGTMLVADGNHRYVRAHETDEREIPGYLVPPETWQRFLVTLPGDPKDMTPERLHAMKSGR